MQEAYIRALEALEVIGNCRPGRCELTSVERAAKKNAAAEAVFAFINRKTKNADWSAKQDAVLVAMNDVI